MNRLIGPAAFACFMWMVAAAVICPAQTTQPADIDSLVAQLAAKLGAQDADEQNIAQLQLQKLGPAAAGAIRAALAKTEDIEVQTRLEAALQLTAGRPSPTYVTLHVKDVPVREVLDELSKQTHIAFVVQRTAAVRRLATTMISLDVADEPFWKTMARICDAADLRPQSNFGQSVASIALTEEPGHWCLQFTDVHGWLAISALSLSRQSVVSYGKLDTSPAPVRLQLVLTGDVNVRAKGAPRITILRCVDELGNLIVAEVSQPPNVLGPIWFHNAGLTLHPLPDAQKANLDGQIDILLDAPPAHIAVADVLTVANQIQVANGVRFRIVGVVETGERQWGARLVILQDAYTPLELEAIVRECRAKPPVVQDALGRSLEVGGLVNAKMSPLGAELEFRYTNRIDRGGGVPREPDKLTWDVPISTAHVVVPFHFSDLPIP